MHLLSDRAKSGPAEAVRLPRSAAAGHSNVAVIVEDNEPGATRSGTHRPRIAHVGPRYVRLARFDNP
jgi:hypothetical protein